MRGRVQIFEVGPRDGLQNEHRDLPLKDKVWFISSLARSGLKDIEFGAFVRPDRVPQMANSDQLFEKLSPLALQKTQARYWGLIFNEKGYLRSQSVGVRNLCFSTAASESFAQRNMGMSIGESIQEFSRLIHRARLEIGKKGKVRVYVSTAFGCPFEGKISVKKAMKVIEKLSHLPIDQVSIGDTIGVGTPKDVALLLAPAIQCLGLERLAVHFHDTRGTALANALRAIDLGVRVVDSSAGGLGGCPFAPGAGGNLATEDLVYMLEGMGMKTGIDLDLLCKTSLTLAQKMKRPITSRYLKAFMSQCA